MQKVRRILGIVVVLLATASLAWAQSTVPIFPSATSPQAIGAEFDVEVKVGNSTNPVSNLFGLSFELNYTNTNFVDVVGSPTQGDFLGSDIIFFPNVADANGKVSVGISRKAGQGGVNGNGTVMKVKFKTLASTPNGTQVQFTITNVSANDPNSGSITLTPAPLTIVIGTIVACPTVSGINPVSGTVGTAVTITGANFTNVTSVKFSNNVPATFIVTSATQISTTVPSGAVTGPITISKTGCVDVQTGTFTVNTPSAPIFPSASSPQLAGAEFDLEVKVGNSTNPVSNLFGLSFELKYTNTSIVDVVGTPSAGDFLGNNIIFLPNVDDANSKVSVGISRKAGQGGVSGNGTVLKARFKTLATTPNGATIQFTLTNVVATDPNGGTITLTPTPLTVVIIGTGVVCPTVSGINPTSGAAGAAVTITGTNFTAVTAVKFANNVTATFTINSTTQITTTVPSGAVTGPITISKTGCTDVQSGTFTVIVLPPTVPERPNMIWARNTSEPITLDGKLDEASWSKAESITLKYGNNNHLIPGSGWRKEVGVDPSDPTEATFKFLVNGTNLYVAATVKDLSVGGGLFNRFDGFLMNMRRHEVADRPAPPFEYFYGWVTELWADTTLGLPGKLPGFFGFAGGSRDATNSQIWDAMTTVQGTSNSDATLDQGYTTEFKFGLTARGYIVTRTQGDIVEFNVSVYDADWQWPLQAGRFSGNRVWLQGPWGNASAYDVLRIYVRPDVTINSGAVPIVGPELVIPNGGIIAAPTIDGKLDERAWQGAYSLDIRYGDDALRNSYPGIAKWRSGQFQPEIGGKQATVLNPGDATIKMFFKGDWLYLAADVRDQAVWSLDNFDQWDGIKFIINDRKAINPDEFNLERRELTVRFDPMGKAILGDYLPILVESLKGASVAVTMKPGTTINNFNDVDKGYNIEIALDLTKLGYPAGRGDGVLFISATLFDGDSFTNAADNYGTRTWWMREGGFNAGPVWAYMDPNKLLTGVASREEAVPLTFALLGNYPNPFNPSMTIQYTMPEPGTVMLKVFDVLGRSVKTIPLGPQPAGKREIVFVPENLNSGVYLYRLEMKAASGNKIHSTLYGKMVFMK